MEPMQLLGDRVLVRPQPEPTLSKGGIIIPETARERPLKGTVIYVGPGTHDEPMSVKPGDIILYGKYSGTDYSEGKVDYLIMRETDIMAVINP